MLTAGYTCALRADPQHGGDGSDRVGRPRQVYRDVTHPRDNRPDPPAGQTGFDVVPERPPVVTFVLLVFVVVIASATAHLFRVFLREIIRLYADRTDPTTASTKLSTATLFVLASAS